jgi:putative endonuclease
MGDLHALGPKGEAYALDLLRARGHQLLQRNFRCKEGELDLITWHQGTLVFVEVRALAETAKYSPAESIGPEKQRKVLRAAKFYLARRTGKGPVPPCRFDVVWLTAKGDKIIGGGVIEGAFGDSA